jgi:hypothetical protein
MERLKFVIMYINLGELHIMSEMKEIEYNGEIFQYKVLRDGGDTYTEFYQGNYTIERRKFLFFGPKIEIKIPISKFIVYKDIESPHYTKEIIRKWIDSEYSDSIGIRGRSEEIKRGEII